MKLFVWFFVVSACCWSSVAAPLIVDHTCVDLYTNLTGSDIGRVKTMWVDILGASHSSGYRTACQLLQNLDSRFQVSVDETGPPEGYTTNHLRISGAVRNAFNQWVYFGVGEDYWYTRINPLLNPMTLISYARSSNIEISATAFGWSWQPTWHNVPGGGIDPVYQVRWAGGSEGGPDGDLRWGLDDDDYSLTGNRISMDTYLRATQQYIDYCRTNNYATKVFFTTGPPDGDGGSGERAYQRHLKYEHIRNYVKASTDEILFDYADILCWSDNGEEATVTWTDFRGTMRTIPQLHADNYKNLDGSDGSANRYHLGERGALRIGKALWYMLARMSEPGPDLAAAISLTASSNVVIQWPSQPNAVYSILQSTNLTSEDWAVLMSGIAATQPMNSFTGTVNQAQAAWFRIRKD